MVVPGDLAGQIGVVKHVKEKRKQDVKAEDHVVFATAGDKGQACSSSSVS